MFVCEAKEKTSQYKGVTYDKQTGKWSVRFSAKGQNQQYGGPFNEEIDAGKRVNQLCKDFGIPQKNPTISAIPNQPYQVNPNLFCPHDIVRKSELCFLTILDPPTPPPQKKECLRRL